jgi:hypothetical protein
MKKEIFVLLAGGGLLATAFALKKKFSDLNETGYLPDEPDYGEFVTEYGVQITPHFNSSEFRCTQSGGNFRIHVALVQTLERLRAYWGKPIVISSGYRTPAYNATLKDASQNSYHMRGTAADIHINGVSVTQIDNAAADLGFGGRGRYYGDGFNHLDIGRTRQPWTG